jgi:hypothetical protein
VQEGGIHLRSAIGGKYLTYLGDGQWTCEAKEAGDATRLLIWCGKDREVKKAKVEKFEGSLGTLELDNIKRYQSWKMNKIVMPDGDRKELYQARKEGLLNEALLVCAPSGRGIVAVCLISHSTLYLHYIQGVPCKRPMLATAKKKDFPKNAPASNLCFQDRRSKTKSDKYCK